MIEILKTSLLLLWRGNKFWVITNVILTPVSIYMILNLYGANYLLVFLAFLYTHLLTDFIFISFTQAIDATEYLVFPVSSKEKFFRLLMQNLFGFKIISFAICIICFIWIVPHLMDSFVFLQLVLLYFITGFLFTNLMLKVKRSVVYSRLVKYIIPFLLLFTMQANSFSLTTGYFQRMDQLYTSNAWLITFVLIALAPLFWFLNFYWFKIISKKEPFYDMEIIINHNKPSWLRKRYLKMNEIE